MKYFTNCTTLEALKKEYRRLCMLHHPDRGGDTATMAAINDEYDEAFHRLQFGHTTTQQTDEPHAAEEAPEAFRAVISRLVILAGIDIEICGSWIWVSGNTYPNREALKGAGLCYSKSKAAWYWKPEGSRSKARRSYTMEEIRDLHGSERIKTRSAAVLTA